MTSTLTGDACRKFFNRNSPPIGLKWRSSYWFITFVVALGLATDMLVYTIIVPVLPFQLQRLGYHGVSGLTGWLLFAFSGGLFAATFPAAMFSERYDARQSPLVLGVIILVGSQIMLMEAPVYWLMVLARVLQGIGSTMVWVVGMALL
ncbi:MFS general substrate transporter [Dendrothele bispora CBS 962.96]|nr:MFS general substrate transporter [Dendrothele bispora CBS 962.96]